MKKLLPIIAVLILLAGGAGVANYLGLLSDAEAPAEAAQSEPAQTLELHPLVISVLERSGVKAHITLVVTLKVAGEPARIEVQRRGPRLRDAFIKDLHALLPLKYDQPEFVQGAYLRERLHRIAEHVVGAGRVLGVDVRALLRREIR